MRQMLLQLKAVHIRHLYVGYQTICFFTHDDWRNDSADENVRAASPSDFTSFSMAERNRSSSSTIDMSGTSVNRSFHHR
jgi:hypothetical protein